MMPPCTAKSGSNMNTGNFNNNCTGAILWRLLLFVVLLLGAALLLRFVLTPVVENDDSQPVGVVTQLGGEVNMIRKNSYYAVSTGVSVYIKDIIITGKDASLQMDMVDGTILRLGDNSRVVLSEYKIDGKKKVIGAMINVLSGWVRFAVAKLQKKASYNFNTPVMMVGVRGTEGIIHSGNEQSALLLQEGRVRVERSYGSNETVTGRDVVSGQFVNRRRGRDFEYTYKVPAYFTKRIPKSFHRYNRMLHRARELERRFVQPTFQRRVEPTDVDILIRRHPYMQNHFRRRFDDHRFRGPGADDPGRKDWGDGRKDWDRRRDKSWDGRRDKSWDDRRDKSWDDRRPDAYGPRPGRAYPGGGYPDEGRPKERFSTKSVHDLYRKKHKKKVYKKKRPVKKRKTYEPGYSISPDYIKR